MWCPNKGPKLIFRSLDQKKPFVPDILWPYIFRIIIKEVSQQEGVQQIAEGEEEGVEQENHQRAETVAK